MSGNEIGKKGGLAIAEALKTSSVRTLVLDGNPIPEPAVVKIAEALKTNSSLYILYLEGLVDRCNLIYRYSWAYQCQCSKIH
jgi:hypothetical protein